MSRLAYKALLLIALSAAWCSSASAQPFAPSRPGGPPFTATLSNITPLVFGMDVEDAARALGTPLNYIGGRPGDTVLVGERWF